MSTADEQPLEVMAHLWLSVDGHNVAGPKRLLLLAAIAEHGSLTAAAKAAGLSYKGAWDAIEQMSNLAGEALVVRVVGGKGGGRCGEKEKAAGEDAVCHAASYA